MDNFIELDSIDLVLALGIMGIAIALSLWQRLGLERQLAFSAVRSLLQLIIVGYILDLVFTLNNPLAVLGILGIMIAIASIVARNRIDKKIKGLLPLVLLSLLASSAFTLGYTILLIVQPVTWYEPQYVIPLAGMLFGNAMNAASLAGDRLVNTIRQNRLVIETHLSLGATPQQAIANYQREAIATSLIPTLNNMMVVGLVSLPGMFTGQVLSGANPRDAASYQILILFAIVLTNLLVAVLVTQGIYRYFFNQDLQLID
ncbi:iron export ABC transporter permease subunit FetB [Myxosarcina sp. GI1]|uniref:ABC transporter permease n=1 Tax=Myxosarcina sp. GI1 TaxID=1541065 RepID=UPI000563C07F|nr:iron export ABC transporter permease subunit FetB [Myxosarcina sp. GI1]